MPPTGPHFLKVPPPSNSTTLGTKPLTHGLLRDIPDPRYSQVEQIMSVLAVDWDAFFIYYLKTCYCENYKKQYMFVLK
jgi:hypothetical protein